MPDAAGETDGFTLLPGQAVTGENSGIFLQLLLGRPVLGF